MSKNAIILLAATVILHYLDIFYEIRQPYCAKERASHSGEADGKCKTAWQ
jgi:hypothetical protein